MRRFLTIAALTVWWPAVAQADECASYGPREYLSLPIDGATVAANAHFHIGLYPSCGGVEGGPRHQFRLLDAQGKEIELSERPKPAAPDCQPPDCQQLELVPSHPLAAGQVCLEVRRPIDTTTLGSWTKLATVTAVARQDQTPPRFAGIDRITAEPIEGSVAISPCEAVPAWELRTTIEFDAADDGPTDRDELLYTLERQPLDGGPWAWARSFQPTPIEGKRMSFHFDSTDWGGRWRYRIRVRDAAGHETIGQRTAEVGAPAEPSEPVSGAESNPRVPAPEARRGDEPAGTSGSGCASCRLEPARAAWHGLGPLGLLAVGLGCRRAGRGRRAGRRPPQ